MLLFLNMAMTKLVCKKTVNCSFHDATYVIDDIDHACVTGEELIKAYTILGRQNNDRTLHIFSGNDAKEIALNWAILG